MTSTGQITKEAVFAASSDFYGTTAQVNIAVEELAECIVAIQKYFYREGTGQRLVELAGEIADVQLVLEQLQYIIHESCPDADIRGLVKKTYLYKLTRLAQRVSLLPT